MQFSSSELQWAAAKKSNINSPVAIHLVWILDFRRPFGVVDPMYTFVERM